MDTIRTLREAKEMTQADLASAIGVTQTTIARYESGERTPGIFVAQKIARALNCTLDDLLRPE